MLLFQPIATQLENVIKSVFELNEDGQMAPPPVPKSAKKSKTKKNELTKQKKRTNSDSEDETQKSIPERQKIPVKKTGRKRKVTVVDSDSDS